jgi:hypothetical protein
VTHVDGDEFIPSILTIAQTRISYFKRWVRYRKWIIGNRLGVVGIFGRFFGSSVIVMPGWLTQVTALVKRKDLKTAQYGETKLGVGVIESNTVPRIPSLRREDVLLHGWRHAEVISPREVYQFL